MIVIITIVFIIASAATIIIIVINVGFCNIGTALIAYIYILRCSYFSRRYLFFATLISLPLYSIGNYFFYAYCDYQCV